MNYLLALEDKPFAGRPVKIKTSLKFGQSKPMSFMSQDRVAGHQ
jgi:hypothetical protein